MQINITMSYYFPPTKRAIIKILTNVGEGKKKLEFSCTASRNVNWGKYFTEQSDSP